MRVLILRELRIAFRVGGGALMGVLFFLAVVTVFPFAIGPDTNQLGRLGPAILWIGALLANLLGLDRLFVSEREDGSLDILVMQSMPLMATIFAKGLAHWMVSGLPLILATPFFGIMLNVPILGIGAVMLTLVVGTPAITFIGTAAASVASSLPRGGLLIAVLTLPVVIPVLIFGITATNGALYDPDPFLAPFLILTAITLFTSILGPLAASFMLRHSAE